MTYSAVASLRDELNLKAKSDLLPPPGGQGWGEGDVESKVVAATETLSPNPSPPGGGEQVAEQVEITAKYAGYIDRQQDEIDRQLANENLRLPNDLDYSAVRGLSKEVQIKLTAQRPETLGQAGRISGVTPAAMSLLLVHLKRGRLAERVA